MNAGGEWAVNGRVARVRLHAYLNDRTMGDVESWGAQVCPYCGCALNEMPFEDVSDGNDTWHYDRHYILAFCQRCSHWEFNGFEGGNKCMDSSSTLMAASVAAKFDERLPLGCSSELAQALRRDPKRWHGLSPDVMERFIADVFKANYRNCEVIHVGGPNDRGIDIIFIDDNQTKWLIQVKRRQRSGKAEGFATLQSVLGTLALEGERHGIIATCADYFSHQARQHARRASAKGFTVELMDKGVLDRMIGALIPRSPWIQFFADPSVSCVDEEVRLHFLGEDVQLSIFDP
jgi:hypothetical protein